MKSEIKTGSFVHVVATINKTDGDGKIMYVNPSVSTIASAAPRATSMCPQKSPKPRLRRVS